MFRYVVCVVACLLAVEHFARSITAAEPLQRWIYFPVNLLVDAECERLETTMRRGANLGYTHFLIADSKFSRLNQLDERYFANIKRISNAAAGLKIDLAPALFPVGYSNDMLSQNPNLAEGLPVREALFEVQAGTARVVADPPVSLPPLTQRGEWNFVDDGFTVSGEWLQARDLGEHNCRLMKTLTLSPFRQYHLSIRIKTDRFTGTPEIKAIDATGQLLSYTSLGTAQTQDWTTHHVTFNSLDHQSVNVYFGMWSGGDGQLQVSNFELEECGPVNVLRRPGAPLVVRSKTKQLVEGVDFEALVDPRLGNQPYAGEFDAWHEPPGLRMKGDWADGTQLRVSYYHPHIVYDHQVGACVCEPEFMKLLSDQSQQMTKLFPSSTYMMSHDEWRVMNWDQSCQDSGHTPGKIAGDNLRRCTEFLRRDAPRSRAAVWSDMFDPYHNAVDDYYLVNGSLSGAWEGLQRDTIVMNWNFDKRSQSLQFFAERGNPQIIAGYYDAGAGQIGQWLETVRQQKTSSVIGVMYTTWQRDYSDLESFARIVTEFERDR